MVVIYIFSIFFKVIGSILIIFCTTLIGVSFCLKERYRKEDFINLERILKLMQHEISYFKVPFEEVFIHIGDEKGNVIEQIFNSMACSVRERKGIDIAEIWCEVWGEYRNKTYFNKQDIDEIMAFKNTLNNLTTENEKESMGYMLSYIKQEQETIERRLIENGRLYYSMGVLSGVFVVVALI